MHNLMRIAERVLNRPLLLHPAKAEVILHVLDGRLPLGGQPLEPLSPEANRFLGTPAREDGRWGYSNADRGVAIVPVIGSLVNRGAWIGANSGMTSYEGLSAQISDAMADPEVRAILLDIDSPGGEATGMFALAEQVRRVGQTKPVTAFVNDMAASAAYGIASAANEIIISPTSVVGSIGVVLTHLDRSGELERKGIRPTLIYAGSHKVDGNPFGPLPDAVKSDLQAEVMQFYGQFVDLVARGRPGMSPESIRATEARTYIGEEAIARGLADRMSSLDETLTRISELTQPARGAINKRTMHSMTTASAAPQAENAGISPEAHAAAVAAARAEGSAAERRRIASIMQLEAAEGRTRQAMTLALETDLSAEQAARVLESSGRDQAAAPVPGIAQRAAAEREFGAQPQQPPSEPAAPATIRTSWDNAFARTAARRAR